MFSFLVTKVARIGALVSVPQPITFDYETTNSMALLSTIGDIERLYIKENGRRSRSLSIVIFLLFVSKIKYLYVIYYPFKLHIYNFKFIFDYYGSQGTFFLKKWIDTNYRIIRTHSKLQFLKHCKTNNIYLQHITHILKTSLNIFHYKAIRKLEGLIIKIKSELLQIEIFDTYKYLHSLNNELSSLSSTLNRLLPNFI